MHRKGRAKWFCARNGGFSYPGAMWTFASDINNSGQIVGTYSFDRIAYHGFVTSPITSADFDRLGLLPIRRGGRPLKALGCGRWAAIPSPTAFMR